MNALKRILAMVMVIAMLMSMAVAEGDVLMISQGEEHIHEEYAIAAAEAEAPALEEITVDFSEEPVEEVPADQEPVEDIPAEEIPVEEIPVEEIPAVEEDPVQEEAAPEAGLSDLPEMIESEEETVVEEEVEAEGELAEVGLILSNDAAECTHPYAQPEYSGRTNYNWTQITEETHTGTYDIEQEYYCPDCGDWFSKITETGKTITNEPHDWDTWTEEINGEWVCRASCYMCDYENTCAHEFEITDSSDRWSCDYATANDNGDGTHTVTFYYGYRYECVICGVSFWEADEDSGYEVTEPHEWNYDEEYDDTFCGYCPATIDCDHEFTEEWDGRWIQSRQDNGDGTHTIEYYDVYRATCSLCGVEDMRDDTENLHTETEAHDFYDGECHECGAKNSCVHPANSLVENGHSPYYDAVVHSKDENGHTISAYTCNWYLCSLCGESFSVVTDEFTTVNQTLRHEWDSDSGECWICGFVNPCEHENVQTYGAYIQPDWENGDPVLDVNANTHTFVGYECVEGECLDCGMWFRTQIGEPQEYTKAHEYYNSPRCNVCDYMPTCTHPQVVQNKVFHYYGEAEKIDNLTHSSVGYLVTTTTCCLCGYSVEAKGPAYHFVEKHYYGAGDLCYECGHKDTGACEHEVVNTYEYTNDVKHYNGNADGHTTVLRDVYTEECALCGKVLVQEYSDTYEETHQHNLNYANICQDCGYQSTCTHSPKLNSYTGYYFNAVSAVAHIPVYYTNNEWTCSLCGDTLLQYCTDVHQPGALAYHTWANGFCTACGMMQPGVCVHKYEDGECVKCGVACTHNYVDCVCTICGKDTHEWDGCVCEKCGSGEHAVGLNDCWCEDCEQTVHDVVNHVCTRCGECDHEHPFGSVCEPCKWCGYTEHVEENFVSKIVLKTTGYKDLTDEGVVGYHAEIRTAYEVTACTVCGQIVSEERAPEWDEEVNAGHTFWYDEDVCVDCGAAKPECPDNWEAGVHEDNGYGRCQHCWYCMFHFDDEADDPEMFDEWGFCNDCGNYFEEFDSSNDGHTHVPVEGSYWYGMAEDPDYTYLDADRHVVTGKQVRYFECDDCGEIIEEETGVGNVSIVEYHYAWESEFCEGCGAYMAGGESACAHENVAEESWFEIDWSRDVVEKDSKTHTAYGWQITDKYCADCGEHLERIGDTMQPAQQKDIPHDFDWEINEETGAKEYYCRDCGYELTPCAWHTWVTEWNYNDYNYVIVDENNHAVHGETCYEQTCSVCGLKQDLSVPANGRLEAHNYENGICGDCGAKLIELTGVKVNGLDENNSMTVGYYMPVQLDYECVPVNSAIKPIFTSSNPYVVSVDSTGKITGMYPGSAVITITANNLENEFEPIQFTVNVAAAPYAVSVQDAPYGGDMLAVGETVQLNAAVLPADTMYELTYTSSNEAVATVDANGLVRGVGAGYAYIYVKTQNNLYDNYLVKVAAAPESMDLGIDGNVLEMGLGMIYPIAPVMTPAGAGSEITYVSSNADVASVDAYGRITAKATGEATITVSTWGLEDQEIAVEVKKAPASVSFARSAVTASLTEGTMLLKPIIAEDEGTKFTWISGNNAVASVDQNGLVTFNRAGSALIAAVAHNGQMALCSITVMPLAPSKITVEPAVVDMLVGEKKELKISFGAYEGCSDLQISESEYFTYEDGILTAKKVTEEPVELVFQVPGSDVTGSCVVNIYPELKDIAITVNGELADDKLTLSYGQAVDLGVQRWDVNGDEMFAGDYTIENNNPYLATIFANNKLYVRGIGTATITVTAYNGEQDTLEIEAVAAPYQLIMTPASAILGKGEKMELQVSHNPSTSPTTYTFYSTNEYVAKVVEENGKYYVVAGENMGYSNIIVGTHNGKYAACAVAVYNAPTAVKLDKTELTMAAGESYQLTTSFEPLYYTAGAITWKSSNENVAKVENGKVIAVGKGTATITAETYNSTADAPIVASCEVKVNNAPASIKLEMAEKMSMGQLAEVKVTLLDKDGNETTGAYTLESSDTRFAWIYNGQVYASYPTWENFPVTIKATAYNSTEENRIESEVNVTVVAAPYYVNIVPGSNLLGMGEKTELAVSHYLPEAPTTYTFVSTNENVAKVVEEDGKYYVQAGETFGFANIIVGTHNGKYAACRINVYNAPTAVKLNESALTLAAGEEAQLTATLEPLYYSAGAITWKSSNENVAKVENGKVIAVAKGTATITAETYNSTADAPIVASCEVKVNNAPASIKLEVAEKMSVGQFADVKVTLLDEDGNETTGAYTVESSYPLFAMMYNGQVYARFATWEQYPVYITAKAFNGAESEPVQVTIVNAPVAIQFAESVATVKLGVKGNIQNALKVVPEDTPVTLSFASSNPAVVSVTADGEFEALSEGYARITVATHNGRYAFIWLNVQKELPEVVQ